MQPENPPAFPVSLGDQHDQYFASRGISVRDYFAAHALVGILAGEPPVKSNEPCISAREAAVGAYRCADAMLLARTQSKDSPEGDR